MNARLKTHPARFRQMSEADVDNIMAIELLAYPFPWSGQIFTDCIRAGYACFVLERDIELVAYGVLSAAAGEAHILNLCVRPEAQGEGLGRRMLRRLIDAAAGIAPSASCWKCAPPTRKPSPSTTAKASTKSPAAPTTTPPTKAAKTPSSWRWSCWTRRGERYETGNSKPGVQTHAFIAMDSSFTPAVRRRRFDTFETRRRTGTQRPKYLVKRRPNSLASLFRITST